MNASTHNEPMPTKRIADEFASWQMQPIQVEHADKVRAKFDELLETIAAHTPPQNGRYLALVKTKLEEASFFAVKGIAKP